MSQWFLGVRKNIDKSDYPVVEETALAMAQAMLSNAMTAANVTRAELARRMDCPRSAVTRMLSGGHNLTVKTMARALAACGFEPRFSYEPLQWGRCETREITATADSMRDEKGRLAPSLLAFAARPGEGVWYFSFGG